MMCEKASLNLSQISSCTGTRDSIENSEESSVNT